MEIIDKSHIDTTIEAFEVIHRRSGLCAQRCNETESGTSRAEEFSAHDTPAALRSTANTVSVISSNAADAFASEDEVCETLVPVEHVIDIYINEILTMRVVCTPDFLPELVIGRLFTEGIVKSIDEIESVYICEFGTRARVFLTDRTADFSRTHVETVPSCCTGNHVLNSYFTDDDAPAKVQPIEWRDEWIFSLAREFQTDSPLHKRTLGTHSCRISIADNASASGCRIVANCEDIGRHNAFDKAVGCALLQGIDLSKAIVYTSGRTPVDMVLKAIRAHIPILATKAVPTDMTVSLAREFDLTLICQARPDSMKIFNDPCRNR